MKDVRAFLEARRISWMNIPGMNIITWDLGAPADPEMVDLAFSMPRLRPNPDLEQFYRSMNGCTILWSYHHDGVSRNGHLQFFPVEEMAEKNFMEEFGYDIEDIPGVSRMGKSAYLLTQNDTDTCIDFRQTPPTVLVMAQRGDIKGIPLSVGQWLELTLLTVGDQSLWMNYLWAQKAGRHKVQNVGMTGWNVLFPELEQALLQTR